MSSTSNEAIEAEAPGHSAAEGADVLVVGAGPTGLTLAIELARHGIPFRLIDREPVAPSTSRALGTQSRTVEVFRLMGIPRTDLEPSVHLRALQVKERNRTLAQITFRDGNSGDPVPIVMDEADTERVLIDRLRQLGGEIERGVEFDSFRIEGDHVISTLTSPDGPQTVNTRFVAGCDGANSTVRREASIGFTGSSYDERFLLEDLELDWALPHDAITIWFGDEAGVVGAVPLPQERHWRLIVALPLSESMSDGELDPASIPALAEEALYRRTGISFRRIGEPVWASSFHIHRKLADYYRSGPVFLAGDAAHVHSPVGGQGMNTGIQDAFNLGWKLALAAKNEAAPGLLDTYEAERRPIAREVLRAADLGTRMILGGSQAARTFREWLLPLAVALPQARRQLLAALSELNVRYSRSPLSIAADLPRDSLPFLERTPGGLDPGQRIADAALRDAVTGDAVRLFDLISGGWTLLLFPDRQSNPETMAALDAAARQVRDTVGDLIRSVVIAHAAPQGDSATPTLIDATGEVMRSFRAPQGLVALARPDGYLGYRGLPHQPGELASYLARVFALRLQGSLAPQVDAA
jgi:2-polyprenyl-6-methoxyphenol hydroxylase-like FAD-dependent oxidoreductase